MSIFKNIMNTISNTTNNTKKTEINTQPIMDTQPIYIEKEDEKEIDIEMIIEHEKNAVFENMKKESQKKEIVLTEVLLESTLIQDPVIRNKLEQSLSDMKKEMYPQEMYQQNEPIGNGPIENEPVDGAIILERRKQESRMERMNQVLGTDIGSEQQTDTCIHMDMDI